MYLKLAFRNAKRSIFDYLLYIVTMTILIAVMCISNSIAIIGEMESGFQTASLPLLIVLIMVALVSYINTFMLKQRTKEFANYLLLGMEKSKLTKMFLVELMIVGILCFFLGALIGISIFLAVLTFALQIIKIQLSLILKSILHTFFYFCIVEILTAFSVKNKISKLLIHDLMTEKRRNQPLKGNSTKLWALLFLVSFLVLFLLSCGIVFLPESISFTIISFISIPLLCSIFSFYKWLYAYFASRRLLQSEDLWQGNRLYHIAEMTTGTKTSAVMSAIFCTCMLFSIMSFVFGSLMLINENNFFISDQQWVGFLQISICIIFLTIYFSILSLQQIIELKRQAMNIRVLHYMGKSLVQIKSLLRTQILLNMFVPTLMCFVVLIIGIPLINHMMNTALPLYMHNSIISSVGIFILCFAVLYFCYFMMVYTISYRHIKSVIIL